MVHGNRVCLPRATGIGEIRFQHYEPTNQQMNFFVRSEARHEAYRWHCGRDGLERTPAAYANHVSSRRLYVIHDECVFTFEPRVRAFAIAP